MPTFQPEVVVLDVSPPDGNAFDVCLQIRTVSRVPVLFLTGRGSEVDKARGFRAGADDYLVKPFLPTELVLRIEALLRRGAWSAEPRRHHPHRRPGDRADEPDHPPRGRVLLSLSQMEVDVTVALASTSGAVWSAQQAARRLGLAFDPPAQAARGCA